VSGQRGGSPSRANPGFGPPLWWILTDPTSRTFGGPPARAALSGFLKPAPSSFSKYPGEREGQSPSHLATGESPAQPMIRITENLAIEDWEFTESFVRASGPGGQNVNKVATAVELRFEAARSPNLPAPVKARLRRLSGRRWTQEGALILTCDETRSQARNREIVRERLAELIRRALVTPKKRIATKPTRASQRRRVDTKKARGGVKALRGRIEEE